MKSREDLLQTEPSQADSAQDTLNQDALKQNALQSEDTQPEDTQPDELILATNLSRSDPIRHHSLFAATNVSVYAGDRIVLSGPSGAGKSVFMRCLALLDPPSSGQIFFKRILVDERSIRRYRTQAAYVRQNPMLVEGTVLDNIRLPFSLSLNQDKEFDKSLLQHYLGYFDKPSDFIDQPSSVLSGGERQIICFLRLLMLSPNVLLLDEPTAALDPDSVNNFERLIDAWLAEQADRAYVWISHDVQQAERMAERHWHMQAGKLEQT